MFGKLGISGITDDNYLLVTSKGADLTNSPEHGDCYGGQEFVRHKVLDVLGTLALTGRQFKNTAFTFSMTGHRFDLYALDRLFEESNIKEWRP